MESGVSPISGARTTPAPPRAGVVQRASVMTVELLERMEAIFAVAGEAKPEQLDLYQRTAANLRRLLEAIGLQHHSEGRDAA